MNVECSICNKFYSNKRSLNRHIRNCHKSLQILKCQKCGSTFKKNHRLIAHMKNLHIESFTADFECHICHKAFSTKECLNIHRSAKHPSSTSKNKHKASNGTVTQEPIALEDLQTRIEIIKSQREKDLLLMNGYSYNLIRKNKLNEKIHWGCYKRRGGCQGYKITLGDEIIRSKDHNHSPDMNRNLKLKAMRHIKDAAKGSMESPSSIVYKGLEIYPDEVIESLPLLDSILKTVRRQRFVPTTDTIHESFKSQTSAQLRVCGDYSRTVNPQLHDHQYSFPSPEEHEAEGDLVTYGFGTSLQQLDRSLDPCLTGEALLMGKEGFIISRKQFPELIGKTVEEAKNALGVSLGDIVVYDEDIFSMVTEEFYYNKHALVTDESGKVKKAVFFGLIPDFSVAGSIVGKDVNEVMSDLSVYFPSLKYKVKKSGKTVYSSQREIVLLKIDKNNKVVKEPEFRRESKDEL